MLKDVTLEPAGGQKPQSAVIILHGLGDSADGIIGLGHAFRSAMPNTVFVAPNAPEPYPYVNGYKWFDVDSWDAEYILDGIKRATKPLNDYIDAVLNRYNLPANKVALVGFSQGTMMSLYVAPRREESVAGVLGYSGMLCGGDELSTECRVRPPVMLIHGTHDDVVPFSYMEEAEAGLKKAQMEVTSVACPNLSHSIDDLGLSKGISFLRNVLHM